MANELHVYTNDHEWIVARSPEDARDLYSELGLLDEHNDGPFGDTWGQADDAESHAIWCNPMGKPDEPHADGNSLVTMTNAEWAARTGRGYLSTTEY